MSGYRIEVHNDPHSNVLTHDAYIYDQETGDLRRKISGESEQHALDEARKWIREESVERTVSTYYTDDAGELTGATGAPTDS